jgi:2-polyprenyl-6-methoxyphenol hydroxylase-like FAD-dependent oxidoreductase
VSLATGGEISARLVVIANGLNSGLRHGLGIKHMTEGQACSQKAVGERRRDCGRIGREEASTRAQRRMVTDFNQGRACFPSAFQHASMGSTVAGIRAKCLI